MFFEQPTTNVTFVNFIVEYILSIPQFLRSFLTAYPKVPKTNDLQNLSLSLFSNFQERGNSHILIAYQYRFQTEYVYKVIKVNLSIYQISKKDNTNRYIYIYIYIIAISQACAPELCNESGPNFILPDTAKRPNLDFVVPTKTGMYIILCFDVTVSQIL